jgi:hypothetical protein
MTTTYTYPTDGRYPAECGLSALEVAQERLGHDGHLYEMRREADGRWQIYGSQHSRNWHGGAGKMNALYDGPAPHGRLLSVTAENEKAAWDALAPRVALAQWPGVPEAMTDDDYKAMLAEMDAGA